MSSVININGKQFEEKRGKYYIDGIEIESGKIQGKYIAASILFSVSCFLAGMVIGLAAARAAGL